MNEQTITTPAQPPAEQGKTPKTDALALHLRLVAHDHEKGTITEAEVNERVAAALSEVEDMERSLAALAADKERLIGLLSVAKCPDQNCDGNGSTWRVAMSGDGEPEQEQCQCQWCDERNAAIDTAREQWKGV